MSNNVPWIDPPFEGPPDPPPPPPSITRTIWCECIKAGEPTVNGRTYTEESLQKMVADAQENVKAGRMLGQLENSFDGKTRLSAVSHKIDQLKVIDGQIVVDITTLPTSNGLFLRAALERGERIQIQPRILGYVESNGHVIAPKLISMDVCPQEDTDANNV